MHDSRKTLLNVFLENIFTPLNIALMVLFVIFLINKEYVYLIPIVLSYVVSLFQTILDFKKYIFVPSVHQKLYVLVNGKETESTLSKLKVGSEVVLYPNEVVNFVGEIVRGIVFVDEKSITGVSTLSKKEPGMSIVKGSIIVEGSAVCKVTELAKRTARKSGIQDTKIVNRIKVFNSVISLLTLLAISITGIFAIDQMLTVSKAALVALPFTLNIFLVIFNFVKERKQNDKLTLLDQTLIDELQDVDVVCLDKTGTITTGEYNVYKTVILSQSSFGKISLDTNRALEQTIANIIKTTKENGGYFKTLQERFFYEPSKIIDEYSALTSNGLYSAVTVHGGNTYALGEPQNFDLANVEAASSSINEYQALGYKVLVLVESKKPLKSGLIDGKPTAIALIILQECIRENIKELVEYCLHNNVEIKVLSGDRIAVTAEACRIAGIDITKKVTSTKLVPFEKIALLVEEDVVFADASPSVKAFIVNELKKKGKRVLYIGDGDNDAPALKAANASIALSTGSFTAKRCAQAVIDPDFRQFEKLNIHSKNYRTKMAKVLSIFYSQSIFALLFLFVFMVANLINKSIYNPFSYHHLWLWSILGIVVPSILIMVEKDNDKVDGRGFVRNFVSDSLLFVLIVGTIYVIQLMQYNGVGFYGIPSDFDEFHQQLITSQVANNLSYLGLLIGSMVVLYHHFNQFNKYRIIAFLSVVGVIAIYITLLAFNVDSLSVVTQINTSELTFGNYFAGIVIVAICSSTYLSVLNLIETLKGENIDAKNQSKN